MVEDIPIYAQDFIDSWLPNIVNMSRNSVSTHAKRRRFYPGRALGTQEQLTHEQNPAQFFTR